MKTTLLILLILYQVFGQQQTFNKFSNNAKFISNPERGPSASHIFHFLENNINRSPAQLIWAYFYFPDEAKRNPISNDYLKYVQDYFNIVRKFGKKIIPRFAYSTEGPDAPMNIVDTHIKQLSPILNENREIILTIHAGFVGFWGEWHSSSNNLNTSQVLNLLLQNFPRSVPISIRYPAAKMNFYGTVPVTESEAVSFTSPKSRVGYHNDCFLKNSHDEGTYFDHKFSNEEIRKYFSEDSLYQVVGGELCGADDATRFACPNALKELAEYHWTYLNSWEQTEWVKGGCWNEIRDRFGYQLFLRESMISHSVYNIGSNQPLRYSFKIENKGFATPVYNRPIELVLSKSNITFRFRLNGYPNMRTWIPGRIITISGSIPSSSIRPEMAGNIFNVNLRLPDSSTKISSNNAYSIGLVNEGVFDRITGLNSVNLILTVNSVSSRAPVIQSLGCFRDNSDRDLPVFWGRNHDRNSCFQKANSAGHRFFGLQNGGECFTGFSHGRYGRLGPESCNMNCSLTPSQNCGGHFSNFIYTTTTINSQPFTQFGCYRDNNVRDFQNHWGSGFERKTCYEVALNIGHKYFALQDGGECYTGNQFGKYGELDIGFCNIKCFADPLQLCGGKDANLVGIVNQDVKPVVFTELGCFRDDNNKRDLTRSWGSGFERNTCFLKAKSVGHKYFGLQFGGECYSGNTYGTHGKLDNGSCQTSCHKDSSQKCGGLFAQNIIQYSTSTSNVLEDTLIEDSSE